MRLTYMVTVIAALAALQGCQRTSFGGLQPQATQPLAQPAPLNPAPVGGVEAGQLGDATATNQFPTAPNAPSVNLDQVASNAQPLTKEELIGRWTMSSGGQSCDVFLSLTKWTGGFRAASRGCSEGLALVSAWNVEGKQVVLADSAGSNVARLYKTATERYDGSTTGGQAINMGR